MTASTLWEQAERALKSLAGQDDAAEVALYLTAAQFRVARTLAPTGRGGWR